MFEQVIAAKVASDSTWHDARRSRSYTWGSPEGVRAAIASLPPRYPMELIADDMDALIRALVEASRGECPGGDEHHYYVMDDQAECRDTCWRRTAGSIAGSIAETVGVEWI